jgi:hypothetical protein
MAYTPTTWVEGVTTLGPTNMNHIENGIAAADTGKVDKDGVTGAGTRIVASKLVSSDTQPAFQVNGDGKLQWGGGGSAAVDTDLYRVGAGQLATDGFVLALGTTGAQTAFGAAQNSTANWWWRAHKDGTMEWGDGTAAPDTSLYRSAANTIANNSAGWGTFQAAAFSVQSDRRTKREIAPVGDGFEKLLDAGVYTYERDASGERHLGLIADELPGEVLAPGEDGMQFVDLYKLVAAVLALVQRLDARVAALEG